MSRLIRICTVCHSAFDFRLKLLFSSMGMSKYMDSRVHFRNSGVKRWRPLNTEYIMKTCLYNVDPIKPHFGLLGCTLFYLFLHKNIGCGYLLELPRRCGFNEYPQSMFWAEIWKISECLSDFFHFLVVKFSVYLNRLFFRNCYVIKNKARTRG